MAIQPTDAAMNNQVLITAAQRDRATYLCNAMYAVTGFDPADESRARPVVAARVIVCRQLLLEGWTEHQIGFVLGWDHSTINHYRRRYNEFRELPGYDAEREMIRKFQTAIL